LARSLHLLAKPSEAKELSEAPPEAGTASNSLNTLFLAVTSLLILEEKNTF